METHRLKQLCVVVESGGFREAARLLHISHSGLSKSMKALEHELGVTLFLPSGRGVVVTDVGRQIYARAKRLLENVDDLERLARGEAKSLAPIRIATFEVFSTYFMGELIEKAFGDRRVLVREAIPGAIEEALVAEEVDIGLTHIPVPRPELEFLRVASLEMGIFGRAERFAKMDPSDYPFCSPAIPVQGLMSSRSLDGWPDETVPRQIRYSVDMMETALDLARRGLGVVYVPTFVVSLHNKTVSSKHALDRLPHVKAVGNRKSHICLVKRRSTEEEATMKSVAKVLRSVTS